MDLLGPWHLLLIAGVFVIMFGAKRLPDAARSLGKSARILKTELRDVRDDHPEPVAPASAVTPVAPVTVTTTQMTTPDVEPTAGSTSSLHHRG